MKIHRLLEMVYMLLDKKSVTAKELAEHFEVSERTIYRDIDILSMASIPIYTTKGKGGGIGLLDNYVINKSLLSDQDQLNILSSLQGMNALQITDVEPVLNKLKIMFDKCNTNWIDVDFAHWGSTSVESTKINILKDAILNKNVLQFEYYNSKGEKTERFIEPFKFLYKENSWYVYGYCREKQEFRMFKIKRIKNLTSTSETFDREYLEVNIISSKDYSNRMQMINLKIDGKMAYRIYDEFEQDNIYKNEDGSFTVKVMLPEDEWVYGYIMSFANYAEVIEPEHIRQIIRLKMEESLKKYL